MKNSTLIIIMIFVMALSIAVCPDEINAVDNEFRFVRIRFNPTNAASGGRRGRDAKWNHDYPTAEYNLYTALERTTKVQVHDQPLILDLSDDRIFEYPLLYICEPGFWSMNETELKNFREYFDRGGFALFDDFRDVYDDREWANFYYNIKRLFPDKELEMISPDHPIWSVYYDIDPIAVPSLVSGWQGNRDADQYWAVFDDNGRMLFIACYNQDIGDGWEYPDRNFDQASTESFKMGINFIIYSLSH